MLNDNKINKPKKLPKPSNGGNSEVIALLNTLVAKQQELSERIEEVEDKNVRGEAALRMVNLLYDTDDTHLPSLTRIPLGAVRPFAISMTLDALTNPKVMSGEVSLHHIYRTCYFQLMRSVGGLHLDKGRELAGEQAASEADKGAELDLGGGQ